VNERRLPARLRNNSSSRAPPVSSRLVRAIAARRTAVLGRQAVSEVRRSGKLVSPTPPASGFQSAASAAIPPTRGAWRRLDCREIAGISYRCNPQRLPGGRPRPVRVTYQVTPATASRSATGDLKITPRWRIPIWCWSTGLSSTRVRIPGLSHERPANGLWRRTHCVDSSLFQLVPNHLDRNRISAVRIRSRFFHDLLKRFPGHPSICFWTTQRRLG